MARRRRKPTSYSSTIRLVVVASVILLVAKAVQVLVSWWSSLSAADVATFFVIVVGSAGLCVAIWLQVQARARARDERFRLQELARRASFGELLAIGSYDFEKTVADLLVELGYRDVTVTPRSHDEGIDIRALDTAGHTVGVQCKQYTRDHHCGGKEISQFIGSCRIHRLDRGIFVTTSSFTRQAEDFALRERSLELWDGDFLIDLMRAMASTTADQQVATQPQSFAERLQHVRLATWCSLACALIVVTGVVRFTNRSTQPTRIASPVVANLSFQLSPSPSLAAVSAYQVVDTGTLGLIVRDAPSGNKKGTIYDGELVIVESDAKGWDLVKGENFEGYVSARYLRGPMMSTAGLAKLGP